MYVKLYDLHRLFNMPNLPARLCFCKLFMCSMLIRNICSNTDLFDLLRKYDCILLLMTNALFSLSVELSSMHKLFHVPSLSTRLRTSKLCMYSMRSGKLFYNIDLSNMLRKYYSRSLFMINPLLACPSGCLACTSSTSCQSCSSGYALQNSICTACSMGTYPISPTASTCAGGKRAICKTQ